MNDINEISQPNNIENYSNIKLKSPLNLSSSQIKNKQELPSISLVNSNKNYLINSNKKSIKKSQSVDYCAILPSFNNNHTYKKNQSNNKKIIDKIFNESKTIEQINDNKNKIKNNHLQKKISIHTKSLPIELSFDLDQRTPFQSPRSISPLQQLQSTISDSTIILDPLFQSTISKSISNWTEIQHYKCQTSLQRFVNFQSDY